jgi:CRP-like cAMP-binding protein
VEQHWYLKQCRLLERLATADLQRLEARSSCRNFARGEVIYLPVDRADAVLAVVSGRVHICHVTPEGKQSILAFIEPGEVFGELCLVDSAERDELAIAAMPSRIVLIPQEAFEELMRRHADLALGITRLVGLRRRRIERRLKSLLFRSSHDRLVQLLVDLAGDYGAPTTQGVELRIKLSHQELASIIGSTRETVTHTLGELQEQGLLILGRQRIVLRSLPELTARVDSFPGDQPTRVPTLALNAPRR